MANTTKTTTSKKKGTLKKKLSTIIGSDIGIVLSNSPFSSSDFLPVKEKLFSYFKDFGSSLISSDKHPLPEFPLSLSDLLPAKEKLISYFKEFGSHSISSDMITKMGNIPFSVSDLLPIKEKVLSYFSETQEQPQTTSTETSSETTTSSFWQAVKSTPSFSVGVISLICSFTISALFYWIGKTLMKIKFEEMFSEKLPRHQQLVYGIGGIQNVDIDRVLLRDDLNERYFSANAIDGSIELAMEELLARHQIMQSLTSQRTLNPEELLSKGDLDEDVFDVQKDTGHITIDLEKVIDRYHLVQSTGTINSLDIDNVLMRDDVPPHVMAVSSGKLEDLSIFDAQFAEGTLVVDGTAAKKYARLLKRKTALSPRKPIVLEIYDDCDLDVLGTLIKNLNNKVVLDLSNFNQDPSVFDQLTVTVLQKQTATN